MCTPPRRPGRVAAATAGGEHLLGSQSPAPDVQTAGAEMTLTQQGIRGAPRYGAATSITRVPQFLTPSWVWLDFGGTYSVAPQIDFPDGSRTANE